MTENHELLAEYTRSGSEAAFRELVARYLNLVYSAAVRLLNGDTHCAEDVTQTVFIDLARQAHSLSDSVMLGGWLHRHTCFVAAKLMRAERRRQFRERYAVKMNALQDNPEATAAAIAPLLDEAINELGEPDRMAILLRFFEQRDFRSVGEALGSNEDAARMRVTRALEKLRSALKTHGVTTTGGVLGVVLAANATHAAPAGLVTAISAATAIGKTTVVTSSTAIKTIAMTTLQKTLITAVVVAAVGVAIYEASHASKLRSEIQALQSERNSALHQLAIVSAKTNPRLSAPPMQFFVSTNAAPVVEDAPLTNLYGRFNDMVKLTPAQIDAYLKANRTNAATLLAAYRTSNRDVALLREAMEKYPNDPRVAFEASLALNRLSPEEQKQWLKTFEQVAPDNALPYYLSAQNDFISGQNDKALQELAAAAGKSFDDYSSDRIQDDEEAYLAAGYSPAEAKTIAAQSLVLEQLSPMKKLGQNLVSLADAYTQSGDTASAQTVLQMVMNLGQNVGGGSSNPILISQLVGAAVETMALKDMNPTSPYGDGGKTVQDYLDQLSQQRAAIRNLNQQVEPLMPSLSDQDMMNFENRRALFGEVAAMQWVLNKFGQQQAP